MHKISKTALLLGLILGTCQAAYAVGQVLMADTVVISGSRSEDDLLEVPLSITVVRPQKAVTADNIPDMLRDVGSVNLVSDGTPGVKHISIRGESASRTVLMVDGQRLDDYKNKSGTPMLVNPFFIERIEVLKGPSSVLYGSDAMGGIVNVITKQASARPFDAEGGVAYIGSGNGFAEYLNVSGTLGRFSYILGGFNTDMRDLYLSDHDRLGNTSYYSKGGNAQLSYAFTDDIKLTFKSEYFDLNARTATTDSGDYADFTAHIPKWRRIKNSLGLEMTNLNDYLARISVSAYVQSNDKDFNSQVSASGPYVTVDNDQDSYGGNLQLELSLGELFYLTLGWDGKEDKLSATTGAQINQYFSISYDDDDYKQSTHAAYALLDTFITDRLTFSAGVRWNYVKTEPGTTTVFGSDHSSFSNTRFVGSAGLVYRAFDNAAFRLNWSQGYRVPNIQELYLTTFTGEMQVGNPDLKPETSDNFEVGFRYDGPSLKADLALFYTRADDYIETYEISGMSYMRTYTYRNIASAESVGAEVNLSYAFDYVTPYLDFTAMQRKYDTGTQRSYYTGTPKLKGRAGVRYEDSFRGLPFYGDFFLRFASQSRNDNLDGSSYFDSTHYAGYVTYNLQLGCAFGEEEQYKVYAGVDNILDRDYQTSELIKEPGRFFYAGFSASF